MTSKSRLIKTSAILERIHSVDAIPHFPSLHGDTASSCLLPPPPASSRLLPPPTRPISFPLKHGKDSFGISKDLLDGAATNKRSHWSRLVASHVRSPAAGPKAKRRQRCRRPTFIINRQCDYIVRRRAVAPPVDAEAINNQSVRIKLAYFRLWWLALCAQ